MELVKSNNLGLNGKVEGITKKEEVKKFTFTECYECGELYNSNIMHETVNGDLICNYCKENYYPECEDCGEVHFKDDMVDVGGRDGYYYVCDSCLEEYGVCEDCGDYAHESVLYQVGNSNSNYVCRSCYRNYVECCECGREILESDSYGRNGYFYCECCYDDISNIILGYSDNPEYRYYGKDPNKLGIELEIDRGEEKEECAKSVIDISDDTIFCKEDSSLNDGFEIVTHPCDFAYHMQNIKWKEILDTSKNYGYRSHDTETCGMHIHVTRSQFTDHQIANMVYFIERNWTKIVAFSRRKEENLARWADKYNINNFAEIDVSELSDGSRYYAVNLTNKKTVELRFFRGTLKYETFIANIQFAHALAQFVKNYESYEMNWDIFVDYLYTVNYQVDYLLDYITSKDLNTKTSIAI